MRMRKLKSFWKDINHYVFLIILPSSKNIENVPAPSIFPLYSVVPHWIRDQRLINFRNDNRVHLNKKTILMLLIHLCQKRKIHQKQS